MTIVYDLRSLFNLMTLCCYLLWLAPKVLIVEDRGEIVSIVPIRAVYGKGFCWVAASQPFVLPVKFDKPVYNIFVSNRPVTVETILGRTFLPRKRLR